jgi:hypothetical protein
MIISNLLLLLKWCEKRFEKDEYFCVFDNMLVWVFKIEYFNCFKVFKDFFKYNLTLVSMEINKHYY